ncbi:MAG: hypothetical protein JJU33_04420 [Phycisphaerales bacterium]|nr:hypothetical protein [Phycisphaerales bacterium]
MEIKTDYSLALTPFRDLPARRAIELASALGYRSVTLDATHPELRARTLDRTARRDLAAVLRRLELGLAGLDLWIPPSHFAEAAHADRAVGVVSETLAMARDLATLSGSGEPAAVVSVLVDPAADASVAIELGALAEAAGASIADHARPPRDSKWDRYGVGIDPAGVMMAGEALQDAVLAAGASLVCARLSDLSAAGRTEPGSPGARLDRAGYEATLSVVGHERPVIVDLRQVPSAEEAAARLAPEGSSGSGEGSA